MYTSNMQVIYHRVQCSHNTNVRAKLCRLYYASTMIRYRKKERQTKLNKKKKRKMKKKQQWRRPTTSTTTMTMTTTTTTTVFGKQRRDQMLLYWCPLNNSHITHYKMCAKHLIYQTRFFSMTTTKKKKKKTKKNNLKENNFVRFRCSIFNLVMVQLRPNSGHTRSSNKIAYRFILIFIIYIYLH